jgi:hypothetical protein
MIQHQRTPELLTPAASGWATGVRLIAINEEEQSSITNRPARSTYPKKKSVSTSGATPLDDALLCGLDAGACALSDE